MYCINSFVAFVFILFLIPSGLKGQNNIPVKPKQIQNEELINSKENWKLRKGADPSKAKFYSEEELEKIRKTAPEKIQLIDAFEKKYDQLKPGTKEIYKKNYLWYWYSKDKEKYQLLIDKVE